MNAFGTEPGMVIRRGAEASNGPYAPPNPASLLDHAFGVGLASGDGCRYEVGVELVPTQALASTLTS
jgi:hypothetical protein